MPEESTDRLLAELTELDSVVSVAVMRGAAVKPRGDVVQVQALNRGADGVLRAAERAGEHGQISIATGQLSGLIDPEHADEVADDVDESLWEEQETGLRHHSQRSSNFLILMATGGMIAACGLLATGTVQAIALVAASVIAPAFEPLAKIPLGLVLRRRQLARHALRSILSGYLLLLTGAGLTMLVLNAAGTVSERTFLGNSFVHHLGHPPAVEIVITAGGAIAGIVMVMADRTQLIAGPLMAMALVPAAAMIAMALAVGELELAARALGRLAIDVGFVWVFGAALFWWKQRTFHRRAPLV